MAMLATLDNRAMPLCHASEKRIEIGTIIQHTAAAYAATNSAFNMAGFVTIPGAGLIRTIGLTAEFLDPVVSARPHTVADEDFEFVKRDLMAAGASELYVRSRQKLFRRHPQREAVRQCDGPAFVLRTREEGGFEFAWEMRHVLRSRSTAVAAAIITERA